MTSIIFDSILRAEEIDSIELTKLTKDSKSFWGYSSKQIEEWSDQLTITKEYIIQAEVYKLVCDNRIIAYYSYFDVNTTKIKLDNLFVLPEFIGNKYGIYLMNDFIFRARGEGFQVVTLDSEPNSENFYKKIGFKVVGKRESTIKNRFLPIMELEI